MLFQHLTNWRQNEPLHWSQFVCLRMTERLNRGSRPHELTVLAEEAADAHRDAVTLGALQ